MTYETITIRYNVTGSERKRLADYIVGFLGYGNSTLSAAAWSL